MNALDRLVSSSVTAWHAARPHRRLLLGVPLAMAVVSVIAVFVMPQTFTGDVAFVVEQSSLMDLPNAVLGLAGQLGLAPPPGQSPQFYADLIGTRPVQDRLLETRPHATCGRPAGASVLQILKPSGDDHEDSLYHGRLKLDKRINSDVDLRTGIVSASVDAPCAELAAELADTLLAALNEFNVQQRRTTATLQREFAQEQARKADSTLAAVEDELEVFMKRNRQFDASPQLKLAYDRLVRRINMDQDLATSLHRQYESARLQEVNDTPVLTILEYAAIPVKPSWPKRRLVVILATGFAATVAFILAVLKTVTRPLPASASPQLAEWHQWATSRRLVWLGRSS